MGADVLTVPVVDSTSGVSVAPSLTAAADEVLPAEWHAIFCPLGVLSGDKRMFVEIGCRPLPLALMYLDDTPEYGHTGAQMCGQIVTCEAVDGRYVYATGTYDLDGDVGREAARACLAQLVRFISVDLTDVAVEEVVTEWDTDDWGDVYPVDGYYLISGNIGKATQCTEPAFMQAVIAPIDVELDMSNLPDPAANGPLGLVASGIPTVPPESFMAHPGVDFPEFMENEGRDTMCRITDEGRIYGRMALKSDFHIGLAAPTQLPANMDPSFPHFQFGRYKVLAADGSEKEVRVGRLTMGIGHASNDPKNPISWRQAQEHYDNTDAQCAYIRCGIDEFGPWYSGALRPGLTEAQVQTLRASGVSVDIRGIAGRPELIGLLVVNVPGFSPKAMTASAGQVWAPVAALAGARATYGDDGELIALVAAGMKPRGPGARQHELAALQHRMSRLEAALEPFTRGRGEQALARLKADAA